MKKKELHESIPVSIGGKIFANGMIIALIFAAILVIMGHYLLAAVTFVFIFGLSYVLSEMYYLLHDIIKMYYKEIEKHNIEEIKRKEWTCSCGEVNSNGEVFCKKCKKIFSIE